uniref:Uncharacterized protein n=1 Tax=uncultured prokaryote TaxID=198431 RepID=A0A0H5Q6G6_9ZZZZ|nr:hypothetical protein [uncultured prokaryote]
MSNIQITEKLFIELIKYHLLDVNEEQKEKLEKTIKEELENKMTKLINRDLYFKYLQAEEQNKREALEKYIKSKEKR